MAACKRLRGSTWAAVVLCLGLLALSLILLDTSRLAGLREPGQQTAHEFARTLQLTDLALFNEARYARHASQRDIHAAFQDHPLALEHFPAGSMVPVPPPSLVHERLD